MENKKSISEAMFEMYLIDFIEKFGEEKTREVIEKVIKERHA